MPANPRRGTREYARQEKARPSQDALIKRHMAAASAAGSEFEADAYASDARATARLDNTVRRARRDRQSTDKANGY